jgi:hypothetical protein
VESKTTLRLWRNGAPRRSSPSTSSCFFALRVDLGQLAAPGAAGGRAGGRRGVHGFEGPCFGRQLLVVDWTFGVNPLTCSNIRQASLNRSTQLIPFNNCGFNFPLWSKLWMQESLSLASGFLGKCCIEPLENRLLNIFVAQKMSFSSFTKKNQAVRSKHPASIS